jgi:hypothetical protein
MRKGGDLGFGTGLSELMLHAALLRLGCSLEPHPEMPDTTKRLDFLVRRQDGERVAYLEITTMNRPPRRSPATGARPWCLRRSMAPPSPRISG